jgi:hypothetical protein
MAVRPFIYGDPGPLVTGPSSTFSMMGVPSTMDNGAAPVFTSTCMLAFPAKFLPPVLNARSQTSRGSWPAQYTFHLTMEPTIMGGMSLTHNVTGTALEQHTLAAGRGPGPFSVMVNPTNTQFIKGVAGSNTFGGGFRASGGGRVNLNVNGPIPGQTLTGYWLSGPRILGHNKTGPASGAPGTRKTQMATRSGTFTGNLANTMVLVHLRAWNVPFTTGMVTAEDHGGSFTTIRQTTGYDNRTAMGEMGTLLLVSPWEANLAELGSGLYFGGTGSLKFTFLPEPGPTALFAAGLLGILAMHIAIRRRK